MVRQVYPLHNNTLGINNLDFPEIRNEIHFRIPSGKFAD